MKELQKINGWICFKNKSSEDVLKVFKNFTFDSAVFTYLNKEKEGEKYYGVGIDGMINIKYTSEFIVRLFCKLMKAEIDDAYYDIKLELEQ